MAGQMSIKPESIEKATKALGSKEGAKSKQMHIEPSDNKGFITHISDHIDGMPTGRAQHHVHANVDALLKHVKETYRSPDLDEAEEKAKESVGGKTKESKSQEAAEGETDS